MPPARAAHRPVRAVRPDIVGATGSGPPGSGPFTTIRRYEELKGPGGPGVLGEEQKRAKLIFGPCWGGVSPGDPENRTRGAILRILVVGELRGMTFKLFYAKLRKHVLSLLLLTPTIAFLVHKEDKTTWNTVPLEKLGHHGLKNPGSEV